MTDSAHPTVHADGDDLGLGTADESKAPNAQAPRVGPSKRKRDGEPSQNNPDPPKRRKGGRSKTDRKCC